MSLAVGRPYNVTNGVVINKLQKMSTRENLSMRNIANEEDVYKSEGKKTYNNME